MANENYPYFTIPYVSDIGKFINYFKKIHNIKLAFSSNNKLNKFIKVLKDDLPAYSRTNVVYKINCLNCEASYVGQTRRQLLKRINEHRDHIKRNTAQISVITEHRLNCSHEFDWGKVEILDEETNYNKRLISEMIFIKKQKRGLNSQNDTALLDPIYIDLLNF